MCNCTGHSSILNERFILVVNIPLCQQSTDHKEKTLRQCPSSLFFRWNGDAEVLKRSLTRLSLTKAFFWDRNGNSIQG